MKINVITNPQERIRFLRFLVVGTVGAIVDFGVFNLIISLTPLPGVVAGTISFSCAIISNFLWNRYWTYPDSRSKHVARQLVQFTFISLIGMGTRVILFSLLELRLIDLFSTFYLSGVKPDFLGHNITLAFSVGVVLLWNFFANRYWTYADVS